MLLFIIFLNLVGIFKNLKLQCIFDFKYDRYNPIKLFLYKCYIFCIYSRIVYICSVLVKTNSSGWQLLN